MPREPEPTAAATRAAALREAERSEIVAAFFAAVAVATREEEVYRALVEHVLRAIGGAAVVVAVAQDGEHLALVAADPPDSDLAELARLAIARGLRVGEGLTGRVIANGEPYFRGGIEADEVEEYEATLPPGLIEAGGGKLPRAAIIVPLRLRDRVVAALYATRDEGDEAPFEQSDFLFVTVLATRATLALEAVAIRQEAERSADRERLRAEFFEAAARAGDDLDGVFAALARRVAEIGGAGWVQELSADGRAAIMRGWHVVDPAIRPTISHLFARSPAPSNEGSVAEMIRTGEPFFVPSFAAGLPAFVLPENRETVARLMHGIIVVPLRRGGRIVGSLGAAHVDGAFGGFDEGDLTFLESLSAAATILLDNSDAQRARVAAAAALAESAGTLEAILDASPVAIVALDVENRVTYWSRAAERLYGWNADEVLGQVAPHVGANAETVLADEWRRIRSGEEELRIEATRVTRTGARIEVVVHFTPLRNGAGQIIGLLTVQEDVTERRRLEAQLLQAQKMETVGRLAGGVAHDFNNILTAIIGYSDIARSIAAEPDVQSALTTIRSAAERAAGLTQQLLAFSRRQMLQPDVVSANEVVLAVEPILRRLIGEDIELTAGIMPEVGSILVDRTQLEQVILNLAINARDAMPRGGRLIIRTDRTHVTAEHSHIEMAPGDYVVISVTDTGTGMDEETKAQIFEPFFTTKEVGKGTGLGLSTVYGIVRQSGGYVWVYSELGRGTTFKLYFPAVGGSVAAPAEPIRRAGGQEARILLVEDDATLRELARRVLARDGFTVLEARAPSDAIAIASEASFDLLVSDVVMPGMTGRDLAMRLREARPDLRVLLMSGYSEDMTEGAIVGSGPVGGGAGGATGAPPVTRFLAKPFTPDTLLRAVDEALGEGVAGE